MHTRELAVGSNTLRFETGKLAKQADGSVIVRFGDSVVLVTACRAANAREGIDFLPLTVDYREYTYASGRIPGGFFKREGKPAEKEVLTSRVHRPADPAAVPVRAGASRRKSSRSCSRPTARTTPTCSRSPARRPRSPSPKSRSRRRSPACASAWSTASTSINPTFQQRKESKLDLDRRRQQRRPGDGRGRREGSQRRAGRRGARNRARGDQADRRRRSTTSRRGRQEEAEGREEGNRPRLLPRGRREGARAAHRGDAHPRQARELRPRRRGARRSRRVDSRGRGRAQARSEADLQGAEGKGAARRGAARTTSGSTAASSTRSGRSGSKPSVLPRTHGSAVFTRGETQALVTCTLGTADDAQKIESFEGETWKSFMLHYNFPPFSVGEVGVPARPGPPRSRPRRARRARARRR